MLLVPLNPLRTLRVVSSLSRAVSKIVAHRNKVVFDESGSFIEKKRSRERLWMREENGVYVLDVYVAPPDGHKEQMDFRRQGIR